MIHCVVHLGRKGGLAYILSDRIVLDCDYLSIAEYIFVSYLAWLVTYTLPLYLLDCVPVIMMCIRLCMPCYKLISTDSQEMIEENAAS
jgi:hypothetical protein